MNNLIHGMRSSQMILPGESPAELAELREEIHDAVLPRDGVEKLLAEGVVRHVWFVRRGEGVRDDRAQDDPVSSSAQTGADISTVEAISDPAMAEPGADLLTVEAISDPATAEPGADLLTVEAISEPATAEPGADLLTVEAISSDPTAEDDMARFGPEADHLRQVRLDLEAIYGAGRPIDGTIPDPGDNPRPETDLDRAQWERPLLRAAGQFTRRQWELSRALDAHFGINGDHPAPGRTRSRFRRRLRIQKPRTGR